ncbi:MAG: hypothetical protein KGI79_00870 [Patescibacteria group bacterium]|nr:hypothetical protein [Patescibacteria group bacterium]MDE2116415.1 hypothetical protein [Patescibacteria group bacterium]
MTSTPVVQRKRRRKKRLWSKPETLFLYTTILVCILAVMMVTGNRASSRLETMGYSDIKSAIADATTQMKESLSSDGDKTRETIETATGRVERGLQNVAETAINVGATLAETNGQMRHDINSGNEKTQQALRNILRHRDAEPEESLSDTPQPRSVVDRPNPTVPSPSTGTIDSTPVKKLCGMRTYSPGERSEEFSSRQIKSGRIVLHFFSGLQAVLLYRHGFHHWEETMPVRLVDGRFDIHDADGVVFWSPDEPFTIERR